MKRLVMMTGLLMFVSFANAQSNQQAGTACTNGAQYCENNNNTTTNNTTTNNTNANTNTNTNTNTSTNTNTNANTNNNTNTNTSTNTNTNANTNVNTNTNNSTNTNANTNTNNNTSTSTNNNTNSNANTNVNTSTVNSTSSSANANTNTNTNTNTNNSTSNNTSNNSNTNVNSSTSDSNVETNNTNNNNNNTNSNNKNENYNKSESVQTINQNVKSPPPSAIAPSIMSYSQDLCTSGVSGAVQTQVFGFSGGKAIVDKNCERLKLSKYLYDMGMKVASVALLCQDERVFSAMEMAGTPCPYMGEIGKKATVAWEENKEDKPNYVEEVEKGKSCKRKGGKAPGAVCK